MRPPAPAPTPTFALNPNPRYTNALSGNVFVERFPGAAMAKVLDYRWLKGVLVAGLVATGTGCGEEEWGPVECADWVVVGPPPEGGNPPPGAPGWDAALQPGDTARVTVTCDATEQCIRVRQSECVAEWSNDGVLNVAATLVVVDATERGGALFWRTELCHAAIIIPEADCGDVIVPDEPTFRVRLNERATFEEPIPFTPQRLEVRE